MVLNKKAQLTYLFIFMMAIVFFVFGMAIAPALTQVSSESKNNPSLNCTQTNLTEQDKTNCTTQDIMPPFFVGIVFALAVLIIGGAIKYG